MNSFDNDNDDCEVVGITLVFKDVFHDNWVVALLDNIVSVSNLDELYWINILGETTIEKIFINKQTYDFVNHMTFPVISYHET